MDILKIRLELRLKNITKRNKITENKTSNNNKTDDFVNFVPKININIPTLIPKK